MKVVWSRAAVVNDGGTQRVGTLYITPDELIFINVGGESAAGAGLIATGGRYGLIFFCWLPAAQWLYGLLRGRRVAAAIDTIDTIEPQEGAMDLDDQFGACPGSFRYAFDKLATWKRTWRGRLRLTSTLDDVYDIDIAGEQEALTKLLDAATG